MRRLEFSGSLRFLVPVACSIFILTSLSCSTWGKPKNDEAGLAQSVEAFHNALRWEDYKLAGSWLVDSRKDTYWSQVDDLHERVRIMEFQLRDLTVEPEAFRGTAHIRCQFYHTRDPRLLTKTLKQRWRYSPVEKVWFVEHTDLEVILETP